MRLPSWVAGRLPAVRHILCSLEAHGNQERIEDCSRHPLGHRTVACARKSQVFFTPTSPQAAMSTLEEKEKAPETLPELDC